MGASLLLDPTFAGPWMRTLFELYGGEKIKPHVDQTFSLRSAVEAHRHLEQRKNIGKVLLRL